MTLTQGRGGESRCVLKNQDIQKCTYGGVNNGYNSWKKVANRPPYIPKPKIKKTFECQDPLNPYRVNRGAVCQKKKNIV